MRGEHLTETVEVLQQYHQNRMIAEDTETELFTNSYFKYPEVFVAAINYGFRFFNEHPKRFSCKYRQSYVKIKERLAFLSVLLKNNPFW
ncbi:hypothetical protein M0804_009786 [Polistes exclamans]|nr:hypothetical protein M0804_009786 [Polistes exclamans]